VFLDKINIYELIWNKSNYVLAKLNQEWCNVAKWNSLISFNHKVSDVSLIFEKIIIKSSFFEKFYIHKLITIFWNFFKEFDCTPFEIYMLDK
jgi:hypothetical protein